jgi:S-DNA-T family DNA segregation ATPase FtsK/SpoIIIE
MSMHTLRRHESSLDRLSDAMRSFVRRRVAEGIGLCLLGLSGGLAVALASWSINDPSLNHATSAPVRNLAGAPGAIAADLLIQILGLGAIAFLLPPAIWSLRLIRSGRLTRVQLRVALWVLATAAGAAMASALPPTSRWPLPTGLGGVVGDAVFGAAKTLTGLRGPTGAAVAGLGFAALTILALTASCGLGRQAEPNPAEQEDERPQRLRRRVEDHDESPRDEEPSWAIISLGAIAHAIMSLKSALRRQLQHRAELAEAARHEAAQARAVRPARVIHGSDLRAERPAHAATGRREPAFEPYLEAPRRQAVDMPQIARAPVPPRAVRQPEPVDNMEPVEEAWQDEDEVAPTRPTRSIVDDRYLRGEAAPAVTGMDEPLADEDEAPWEPEPVAVSRRAAAPTGRAQAKPAARVTYDDVPAGAPEVYELPSLTLLSEPKKQVASVSKEALEQNATLLESTLEDFGVRGEIINVRPGPVVTLYELEPAPGTKSSRVIGLADDIARSMSAVSARVAVVQGRNAIGVELPNVKRETVYLRELLDSPDFGATKQKLALCLGKTIGGEPVIADLARMPHLLVAGTTGSGKSVAINTMILSLLYRHTPEQCRLIMVDPKMLELSVYEGIPHLLTPVVTDPKKAVVALKWAVREMEDRYRKMSKVGVRNIDGFNERVAEALAKGEVITRSTQTGFDRNTGETIYEDEVMDLKPLPYIVVIVDEMADLMMVAGKDIEGAIQRLAQMARAAGIHVILATQRPSVDVITGTIKANFPTRISFQVTSKIDSRTILGEMGAEQLLGQGDMLYMAGGGRTTRVHGPFVSDSEVEHVVDHIKRQGRPQYLEAVTSDEENASAAEADAPVFDKGAFGEEGGDLYEQAIQVVLRDKKASTSYIQRRLGIGYNRAASLMERMETEGIVGPANHAGKRDILMEAGEA